MDAAGIIERVALHEKSVAGGRQDDSPRGVRRPVSAAENRARAAERMDVAIAIERVAQDCVPRAGGAEHEGPRDSLARPHRVAHRGGGAAERVDAAVCVEQVPRRVARG